MLVLMEHSTESVASSYIEAGELVRNHERHGQWSERAGGGVQNPDSPAGVLDHREHVQPRPGQGDRLEEVTGQQGLRLAAQETGPRSGTALGRGVDPSLVQDVPDGGSGDPYPEHQQFAVTRRYPHPGFSRTSRNTKTRIERTVRGRPRCRGRDRWACRRATISRCQRSTVSRMTVRLPGYP